MKRAPLADQADRARDALEAVGARLAEHDVVGVALGQRVAGLVQRGRQPGLADHERRCRPGAGRPGSRAVASAEVQIDSSGTSSPLARSRAARSRARVDRVVGQHQEREPALAQRAPMKRSAPGIACSSWTSTPSMSISQEWISRRVTRLQLRGSPSGRIAGASAPTAGRWREAPAAADHHHMINLGTNPVSLADRRAPRRSRPAAAGGAAARRPASRSSTAARSPTRSSTSTTGPVGYRRTWSGAEELAHQYADLREAA